MENAIDIITRKEFVDMFGYYSQDEVNSRKELCNENQDYNCVILCKIYRKRKDEKIAKYYYNKISSDKIRLDYFFDKAF